jgi:RNA polymerase sigma-70 factor (ECF subfamily)
MKEYTDMDYKQIAQVLHISESNVKVRVYRARKMLESILSQE